MTYQLAEEVLKLEATREKRNLMRVILAARAVKEADRARTALGIPSCIVGEK